VVAGMRASADEALHCARQKGSHDHVGVRELPLAWWDLALAIPVAMRLSLWMKGATRRSGQHGRR